METSLELAARNAFKARTLAILGFANNLKSPLVYADIGALWGVDNPLAKTLRQHKRLRVVGFEPDEAECKKLQKANPGDIYLPVGVGDEDGTRKFYVTFFGACSSFLEPDESAFAGLPHAALYRVARTPELPVRRFDSLIADGSVPQPDFVKMDVQGFELQVLQGFGDRFADVLGVRFETQLRPMYKGQALFHELYDWLRGQGMILRDVRVTYPVAYEVIELEAYFSRDPRNVKDKITALRVWELLHDIPPGRTVAVKGNRIEWKMLNL